MVIVMSASVFAWILTTGRVAQSVFSLMTAVTTNYLFVLIMLNILLLIAGCFMDAISAYYIFIPLFLPSARSWGRSRASGDHHDQQPRHRADHAAGGVDLYTASAISGVPFKDLCRRSGHSWLPPSFP